MDMLDLVVDEIKNYLSNPSLLLTQEEDDDNGEFDFSMCKKDSVDISWLSEFE